MLKFFILLAFFCL